MPGPRLTQYSSGGGCACKLPQSLLSEVLSTVKSCGAFAGLEADPALQIGLDTPDDAAVYAIDEKRALVLTCDFITPVVDDPYEWGRIAATNALSDVYAMGGRPLLTMNLLSWTTELPHDVLTEVLRGGAQASGDAGALLVGGHSILDPVPKYGMVAIGEVDPCAVLRKGGGHAGDVLVLTKPVGVGVVGTAIKRGQAWPEIADAAVAAMTRLNADAAAVARAAGLRGATDVSGYGLIGHLHEMALAAGTAALIDPSAVPRLDGVIELVAAGCTPDGTRRTLDNAIAEGWFIPGSLNLAEQVLVADAQTSGGLLLAVPPAQVDGVLTGLRSRGDTSAAVVGALVAGESGHIMVGQEA